MTMAPSILEKLEQAVRGKRNVEREAVVTGSEHVFSVTDADKGTQVTGNDHVRGRCGSADQVPSGE